MDAVFNVLLGFHILGLVMGMGGGIANSRIGPMIGAGDEHTRPTLWALQGQISKIAHAGLGLLLITGVAMVGIKFWPLSTLGALFWVKMALVVVLIGAIVVATRSARLARGGNPAAAGTMKKAGMTAGLTALAIIFVAVFAFG